MVFALHMGGKKPRYIVALLLGEDTGIGVFEPDEYRKNAEVNCSADLFL
ncbi:hypothetical protein DCCM_3465 [Desulfocucumis palustris]|uniref:Uncharacterized protein n=1 Tax=Desulfocucumis palustris TaxID=1898651 RepID=A0A2L2XF89_9FIRM|nr:hypothetical protein DCCM_3465 [Desulfocucumis palustris]